MSGTAGSTPAMLSAGHRFPNAPGFGRPICVDIIGDRRDVVGFAMACTANPHAVLPDPTGPPVPTRTADLERAGQVLFFMNEQSCIFVS